jgi:hypothetical protein
MSSHRRTNLAKGRQILRPVKLVVGSLLLIAAFATGIYTALAQVSGARTVSDDVLHPSSAPAGQIIGFHRARPLPTAAPTHKRARKHAAASPKPGSSPATAEQAARCSAASNTPGGPDPWGGCWPGPGNAGVPAGVPLSNYTGSCNISASNTVIDGKNISCGVVVTGSNVTIKNSQISGTVQNNGNGNLLIEDTTINGGNDQSESIGGSNITLLRSNLYGDQHEIYCGSNCTVEDSWLHDNFNGQALGWHQNGFLSTGGSGYTLVHNSVYCVGGCTADITFIPNDNISNATISKNLLVASPNSAYCLYPSSDHPGKPGNVSQMTVTDNVFQSGSDGKCATYGPVYGWDSPTSSPGADGYHNVWSGNKWNDGKALGP